MSHNTGKRNPRFERPEVPDNLVGLKRREGSQVSGQHLVGRRTECLIGAGNLESPEFLESCRQVAEALGIKGKTWRYALRAAAQAQAAFERRCCELGRHTLDFCGDHGIVPVVVLGRPYTIYNKVLNSNVPALLREQGAIGIPLDCYPVSAMPGNCLHQHHCHLQKLRIY